VPLLFLDESLGLCRLAALLAFEESPLTEDDEEVVVVELERSSRDGWWIEGRVLD
jgi:hypothetical protein